MLIVYKSIDIDEYDVRTLEWDLNYQIVMATEELIRHMARRIEKGMEILQEGEWNEKYRDFVWIKRLYKMLHGEEIPFVHPYMQAFAVCGINDYEFVDIDEDRTA